MSLSDEILPLVRSRADLHRWRAANEYGVQLHDAVALLRDAAENEPPAEVLTVTQKAIASACKVIMRADDSSGIIGDAIRDLLDLHAQLARTVAPPFRKLVDWMIRFQFDNECDFFEIDPVTYGPALGELGMAAYRAKLAQIAAGLNPAPTSEEEQAIWRTHLSDPAAWEQLGGDNHTRFVLSWNARRLSVWDRDVEAIIATHVRDRKVAAWLEDTAQALAEIGEFDLAIDWARQATFFDTGHQSEQAASYWCALVAAHRPDEELAARLEVFHRWPTSMHAGALHKLLGPAWPDLRKEVMDALESSPREAVGFALHSLGEVSLAWELAHFLDLGDAGLWEALAKQYEVVEPLAVLPIYADRVRGDLEHADAGFYGAAARRLAHMRTLAKNTSQAPEVDRFIAELREIHRRRPRLQQEFDRAGLPKQLGWPREQATDVS